MNALVKNEKQKHPSTFYYTERWNILALKKTILAKNATWFEQGESSLFAEADDVTLVGQNASGLDERLQSDHPLGANLDVVAGCWVFESRNPVTELIIVSKA